MKAIAALVNKGFRRVERAGEAAMGRVGPLFVAIYVILVGSGMIVFCMCHTCAYDQSYAYCGKWHLYPVRFSKPYPYLHLFI